MIQKTIVVNVYIMKLSELSFALSQVNELVFVFPDGRWVPPHFHLTEVGLVAKKFIDCGGTLRTEEYIQMQLWTTDDMHHRLLPSKFTEILHASIENLQLPDYEVYVEYQGNTIEKYGVHFTGQHFNLIRTETACLAEDACGIPTPKANVQLTDLGKKENPSCTPGSGCC